MTESCHDGHVGRSHNPYGIHIGEFSVGRCCFSFSWIYCIYLQADLYICREGPEMCYHVVPTKLKAGGSVPICVLSCYCTERD